MQFTSRMGLLYTYYDLLGGCLKLLADSPMETDLLLSGGPNYG